LENSICRIWNAIKNETRNTATVPIHAANMQYAVIVFTITGKDQSFLPVFFQQQLRKHMTDLLIISFPFIRRKEAHG